MAKIYVASSWRNQCQQEIVELLRQHGHKVYDFKHPHYDERWGFSWNDVDTNWQNWNIRQIISGMEHPIAKKGFNTDLKAMVDSDICVLLLPCGKSAHAEAGYMAGIGKRVVVAMFQQQEAELMYKLFDKIVTNKNELVSYIEKINAKIPEQSFLNLIVDGIYYDMIFDEIKKEEYREIKPYWIKRLFFLAPDSADDNKNLKKITNQVLKRWEKQQLTISDLIEQGLIIPKPYTHVCFRRGYTSSPLWVKLTGINIAYGNPEWGAPKDKEVFILRLGEITEI